MERVGHRGGTSLLGIASLSTLLLLCTKTSIFLHYGMHALSRHSALPTELMRSLDGARYQRAALVPSNGGSAVSRPSTANLNVQSGASAASVKSARSNHRLHQERAHVSPLMGMSEQHMPQLSAQQQHVLQKGHVQGQQLLQMPRAATGGHGVRSKSLVSSPPAAASQRMRRSFKSSLKNLDTIETSGASRQIGTVGQSKDEVDGEADGGKKEKRHEYGWLKDWWTARAWFLWAITGPSIMCLLFILSCLSQGWQCGMCVCVCLRVAGSVSCVCKCLWYSLCMCVLLHVRV